MKQTDKDTEMQEREEKLIEVIKENSPVQKIAFTQREKYQKVRQLRN